MIFNIVLDAVARAVLVEVFAPQEAQYGLVLAAGERNMVFYVDYGQISGRYPIWVQDAHTLMVVMFKRVGLETNPERTN